MGVLTIPIAGRRGLCLRCGRAVHAGRCVRDVTVGRDQYTDDRRLRLANLQRRVFKVRPFAVDVEAAHE